MLCGNISKKKEHQPITMKLAKKDWSISTWLQELPPRLHLFHSKTKRKCEFFSSSLVFFSSLPLVSFICLHYIFLPLALSTGVVDGVKYPFIELYISAFTLYMCVMWIAAQQRQQSNKTTKLYSVLCIVYTRSRCVYSCAKNAYGEMRKNYSKNNKITQKKATTQKRQSAFQQQQQQQNYLEKKMNVKESSQCL